MPRTPAQPATDPLADLRPADPAPGALEGVGPATEPQEDPTPVIYDQAWHDDATAAVVARWHADRTAQSYAHKGGTCGCRYLAAMALLEAVGRAEPPADDDQDGDGRE